ncbi:MAG: TRAP transporter small permease [Syntrophorhabdaceae bacterium]|nr:TRAP transporter small permease [Syntrophorhabdaceae bacterium]
MESISNAIKKVTRGVCFIGMFFAIPLMLITTVDAIGRDIFDKPFPGTIELSEYMLSIIILLGAAYTQQVKGHVGVDFFTKKLSVKARSAVGVITTLASMFIIAIVIWQGFVEGIHERTVSDMIRVPQRPFRLLVSVGGFLLWLELLLDLLTDIKILLGGSTND